MSPQETKTTPSSSTKTGFLKIVLITIALILFGIFIGVIAARFLPVSSSEVTPNITPTPTIIITTPTSTPTVVVNKYTCPTSGWVDCMPVLDEAKKIACSDEALAWYKANCSNFKGSAL